MSLTLFGARPPPSIIAQLSDTEGDEPRTSIATWGSRRFVVSNEVARKGYRGRSSWISSHGIFVNEISGATDIIGMLA